MRTPRSPQIAIISAGIKAAFVPFIAAGIVLFIAGCKEDSRPRVVINGHSWFVEIASTPQQHYTGLSGRDKLAENEGMLFMFPEPQVLEFCMRGCLIPLDIAFIDSQKRVICTYTMFVEKNSCMLKSYSSQGPAQYALEVPAGSLKLANVKTGDKVIFSLKY